MDLKERRQQANLRIIDVAYQLNIAEKTVRNWETGRTIPKLRLDQLGMLAELYGCTVNDLYEAMQETQAKVSDSETSAEE